MPTEDKKEGGGGEGGGGGGVPPSKERAWGFTLQFLPQVLKFQMFAKQKTYRSRLEMNNTRNQHRIKK